MILPRIFRSAHFYGWTTVTGSREAACREFCRREAPTLSRQTVCREYFGRKGGKAPISSREATCRELCNAQSSFSRKLFKTRSARSKRRSGLSRTLWGIKCLLKDANNFFENYNMAFKMDLVNQCYCRHQVIDSWYITHSRNQSAVKWTKKRNYVKKKGKLHATRNRRWNVTIAEKYCFYEL